MNNIILVIGLIISLYASIISFGVKKIKTFFFTIFAYLFGVFIMNLSIFTFSILILSLINLLLILIGFFIFYKRFTTLNRDITLFQGVFIIDLTSGGLFILLCLSACSYPPFLGFFLEEGLVKLSNIWGASLLLLSKFLIMTSLLLNASRMIMKINGKIKLRISTTEKTIIFFILLILIILGLIKMVLLK